MPEPSSTESSRTYDLVVFGATGFTGQKVAEYLAKNAPPGVRWAVAGRSATKLDVLKARLRVIDDRCRDVGIVLASVDDPASLSRMARSARVLVTTVGPFIDYGEPVVRACIEEGTDYVDSTGEPNFVNLLLARYDAGARSRNVRVVPSCGFDSIPADLGAFFTVQKLPQNVPIRMSGYMKLRGTFSGGTEQSAIKSLVGLKKPSAPSATAPNGRKVSIASAKVQRRPDLGGWTAPLPTIDAAVVARSARTIDRYGPDFSYAHHVVHPNLLVMLAAFWFFGSLALFVQIPPFRALLLKMTKKSGQGPTDAQMQRAWFKIRFEAECGGYVLRTEVSGGDPGYGETSKMLGESALCLLLDRASLPHRAGVLTPVEAMGDLLVTRLQRAGLRFEVVPELV